MKKFKEFQPEKKDCTEEKLADVISKEQIEESASIEEKLEEALLDETSSRLKTKFIRLAEPKAKAQGFVGHATGNQGEMDKADRTLKMVQKVKSKLDLHGIRESEDNLESIKQNLENHVVNTVPSSENISKMHMMIHSAYKHGANPAELYRNIASNSAAHEKYRTASSND